MFNYNIKDWYWIIADKDDAIYASGRASYINADDAEYLSWVAVGGFATRVLTEAEVEALLRAQYPAGWPGPRYVPVYVARERLETMGKWGAAATAIAADPAMLLKVATLKEGLDVQDPAVLGLLAAIGADPAVILAI